jgi:ABC-type nitrate/sulfonate/bicarbonate transport system ATPase subunit
LLLRIWQKQRLIVLLITHAVDETLLFSDLVYMMAVHPDKLTVETQLDY